MSQAGAAGSNGGGGGAGVTSIAGNSGGAVSGTVNLLGSGGVTVVGDTGSSTLTISVSGSTFSWNDEAVNFNAASSNGYFCTAPLTATLPAGVQGDSIKFVNASSGNLVVQAAAGQKIQIGAGQSSVAGSATASVNGNTITLVYMASGQIWYSDGGPQGTWALA